MDIHCSSTSAPTQQTSVQRPFHMPLGSVVQGANIVPDDPLRSCQVVVSVFSCQ